MSDDVEIWVWGTWTDELNAALHPLGIALDGVEAATILEPLRGRPLLDALRAASEDDVRKLAEEANRFLETHMVTPAHIRTAIDRTKWHYQDA